MHATAPVRSPELQAQVVAAVAPLAALDLADQEDLVDLHAVGQLVQEHGLKVDGAADGTLQAFADAAAGGLRRPRRPGIGQMPRSLPEHRRRGGTMLKLTPPRRTVRLRGFWR